MRLQVTLAQAAAANGSDTGIIVAAITAAGVVLAALVSLFGLRLGARLDAIEKSQGTLGAAIERLERRMEDGLARLADRIDRLYGSAPAGPTTTTRLPRASTEGVAVKPDLNLYGGTAPPRGAVEPYGGTPPDPGPRGPEISAAELSAQLRALREAVEAYSEQQEEATPPTEGVDVLEALRQSVEASIEKRQQERQERQKGTPPPTEEGRES